MITQLIQFAGAGDILLVLVLTALSCSLLGCFLVLRKLSMVADAISHSVFLGIVLAFFVTEDLSSPWLVVAAGAFGVLTVYGIELLAKTGLIQHQDAVGVVYPFFFSVAVILTSKYAQHIHLDLDAVLMGEVLLTPLETYTIGGITLPQAAWVMGALLLVNVLVVTLLYKELLVTTFDSAYASVIGFSSTLVFYILMTLVSMTTVAAFEAVGAILVISFLITAPASAYLVTKRLPRLLAVTAMYALVNSFLGFACSIWMDVSMSGMTAVIGGGTFLGTFLLTRCRRQVFLRANRTM